MTNDSLELLTEAEVLSALDARFARQLAALARESSPAVLLAAALASRYTRAGHVCVDLRRLADQDLRNSAGDLTGVRCPGLQEWLRDLWRSPLLGTGGEVKPLVLDAQGRVYLRRYWQHEQVLAEDLRGRAMPYPEPLVPAVLQISLHRLFGPPSPLDVDWQRVAAQLAVLNLLTVISGGPGTGKTSIVVKLLALLVEQALVLGNPPPRTLLLAPTGKAAQRLVESIQAAKARLGCGPEVSRGIAEEASTIHRALGALPGHKTRFLHDSARQLPTDLVIVDESSMVDVALMRRLAEAIPLRARLVLLGDRDQLASVEAGAVLGDLCGPTRVPRYSSELGRRVQECFGEPLPAPSVPTEAPADPTGLGDCIVQLTRSYRFDASSGIGALARAIQDGDLERALDVLATRAYENVQLVGPTEAGSLSPRALHRILEGYRPYTRARDPLAALTALGRFRVLCAHRRGSAGVEELNTLVERALERAGHLQPQGRHYELRPVIITENDYALGLFNGDIGVMQRNRQEKGELRVFFAASGQKLALAPARLPPHETVFAMSIHKSQGSEFEEVLVVLPDPRSPLLTRELLYTAVTRARDRVVIHGTEAALRAAIGRRVDRASGLMDKLWGEQG